MVYKHVVENVIVLTGLEYDPVIHGLGWLFLLFKWGHDWHFWPNKWVQSGFWLSDCYLTYQLDSSLQITLDQPANQLKPNLVIADLDLRL